ncbi:hypothetical protein BC940DRAFT_288786 [Gongronella butleri]|nr:hypothetical protein BC940DRAFT_288786 [Gongronella butleri]
MKCSLPPVATLLLLCLCLVVFPGATVADGNYGNIPTPSLDSVDKASVTESHPSKQHTPTTATSPTAKPASSSTVVTSGTDDEVTTIVIISSNGHTYYDLGHNGNSPTNGVQDPNAGQIESQVNKDAAEVQKLIAISTVVGGVGVGVIIAGAIFYIRYRNKQNRLKCNHPDHHHHHHHDAADSPSTRRRRHRRRRQHQHRCDDDESGSPSSPCPDPTSETPASASEQPTSGPIHPPPPVHLIAHAHHPSLTSSNSHDVVQIPMESAPASPRSPTSPTSTNVATASPILATATPLTASAAVSASTGLPLTTMPPLMEYDAIEMANLQPSAPLEPTLSDHVVPERLQYSIIHQQRAPPRAPPVPSAPPAKELELTETERRRRYMQQQQHLQPELGASSSTAATAPQQLYPSIPPPLNLAAIAVHTSSSTSPLSNGKSLAGSTDNPSQDDEHDDNDNVPATPDVPPPAYTASAPPLFNLPPPRRRRSADDISLDRYRRAH